MLWKQGERSARDYPQPAPPADGSASVVYPLWRGLPQLPDPLIECWLTPAMIVVDDCVIDKEFNAFVARRISEGASVADAETEARANASLDPLVAVAPILPYRALRAVNEQAVRQSNALGYFPVIDCDEMDEGYVDFLRTVPVSRQVLWGPVAALSDPARRILRWKLAQFYGFRNLSVDAEIMAAIGKTITDVRVMSDTKNRLVVDLDWTAARGSCSCVRNRAARRSQPGISEADRAERSNPLYVRSSGVTTMVKCCAVASKSRRTAAASSEMTADS